MAFVVLALVLLGPRALEGQLAPADSSGIAFGHLHLNVSDLALHRQIWVDQFGGTWVDREPVQAVWIPGALLMFNEVEPEGGTQGSTLDHFGLKVRDYDAVLSGWRHSGLQIQSEFEGVEGNRNAYLLTPDGLRIEIQEDVSLGSPAIAHHLHWFVPDAERGLTHYASSYELREEPRGSIRTTTNVPGMNLSFSAAGSARRAGTRGRVLDHIGFEIDGLEAYAQRLEARGVTFEIPYRVLPGLGIGVAFYTDPSGVLVELTEGLRGY